MKTKTKVKRVSRGMLEAAGETVTAAKEALAKLIDWALTGTYDPEIVTFGRFSAVVFRTPQGWEYETFGYDGKPLIEEGSKRISAGCCLGAVKRDEAIQRAAFHVIQNGCPLYERIEDIPAFLTDENLRKELLSWCRWQRAYKWAKENKPEGRDNDNAWHEWASWHSNDPQFA